MEFLQNGITEAWRFFSTQIGLMDWQDILDILVVAVLLYQVYRFIRDRRAGKLFAGVIILILLQFLSELLGLNTLHFLMQNVFQAGLVALVVVFQPELRSALEKIGGEPLKGLKSIGENRDQGALASMIKEICEAASDLSASKTGALIVLERSTKLGDVIKSGVVVNADVSSFLLKNIFFNKAPLHDGAVVIREGRIYAAGCFLPLSTNEAIIKDLGTRHRAGIGMSENSDALVIIVSEETGTISLAKDGQLRRGFNYNSLKRALEQLLLDTAQNKTRGRLQKNPDSEKHL